MVIFIIYAIIFILFEVYDRLYLQPFEEASDWHLLLFSIIVMIGLAFLLHRYSKRMDERISKKQAEKEYIMRRELTQNISHELKTPVSSILGFTDTIIDNPNLSESQIKQFILRTNKQAKRLAELLSDISTLNRMEYAPDMIKKDLIDISEIVSEICSEVEIPLKNKNMSLKNFLKPSIYLKANYALMYSIFRNIIDNSINYAGNDTVIEISACEHKHCWVFSISDNGIGVSSKHLNRLFERFYRVNKGRMRTEGGTGLGLSIVKNAVLFHGGTIKALNNNPGIRFEFTIKK